MAFEDTWNATYEGIPADTENVNLGAARIRDLKVNIRERAGVDHSWGDTEDNGQHNQISFNVSAAEPAGAGVANTGYLYTQLVNSNAELFWTDSEANTIQLTSAGVLNTKSFPAGTVLGSFLQTAPPTGWTANTGFSDQMIRTVADASGGNTGGSWSISGTALALNRGSLGATTVTADTGSTVTIAGHVLSVGEIPSHTHNVNVNAGNSVSAQGGSGSTPYPQYASTGYVTDGGTGGNGAHSHPGSTLGLSLGSTTTLSGVPAGTFSNDSTWRPAYVNACVGTKT